MSDLFLTRMTCVRRNEWSPTALQPWPLLCLRRNPPERVPFAKASEDTRCAFLHSVTAVASCVGG
jgi:hypothetical protein